MGRFGICVMGLGWILLVIMLELAKMGMVSCVSRSILLN